MRITLTINQELREVEVEPHETLLNMLRREGFNGAKRVCESGECGACAVILDGRAVDSCIILAAQADRRSITTVEGLGDLNALSPVQEAFADNGSVQCGFCIPGMIVTATNYLRRKSCSDARGSADVFRLVTFADAPVTSNPWKR